MKSFCDTAHSLLEIVISAFFDNITKITDVQQKHLDNENMLFVVR